MKQVFYISIIAVIFLLSCEEKDVMDDQIPNVGVFMTSTVDVYFKDSDGNDLLDTLNENHYDSSEIKLFNLIDGEIVEYRKVEVDGNIKTGLLFYKRDDINSYCVRLIEMGYASDFDMVEENDKITFKSISYLQLNEHDMDTIKREIEQGTGDTFYSKITKVWYNDDLKWTTESGTDRLFEVIK